MQTDLAVTFTGSASGSTAPYAYSWDVGDGSGGSSLQNPQSTYTNAGNYTVSLMVTDDRGGTKITTQSVTMSF